MANNISGKVVNEIEFKINKKSWDNLTRFQQKITNVKRQLSGLNKSIKVQAVVNSINKVTSATGRASQKMYDAHTRAYEKHVKDRNRIEQQIEYRTLGTQMAFRRRMIGADGRKRDRVPDVKIPGPFASGRRSLAGPEESPGDRAAALWFCGLR